MKIALRTVAHEGMSSPRERWLGGHPVKIVDGTGLSMPDTPANQTLWPQPTSQQPGCGFPVMRLVGLFSLSSGALLETATGNLHVHESLLFRPLWDKLKQGDGVLADRGFCSYAALASLAQRGVDSVLRLHQKRRADFRSGKMLGPDDRLITGAKPAQHTEVWSVAEFAALPETLLLLLLSCAAGEQEQEQEKEGRSDADDFLDAR